MIPIEAYKSLGFISIAITWVGLIFLIRKWQGNKSMSFSNHAASSKSATIFYGLLFSTTLPLFYLFVDKWFVPAISLPRLFTYLVIVGCLGQLIAAWVPGTSHRKELIHSITAYTMHTLLLPLVLMILIYGDISTIARVTAATAQIYMVTVWLAFAFIKSSQKYTLKLQSSYVLSFHAAILITTYVR